MLRVALQDNRRLVREGLAAILRDEPDLDVIAVAADAADMAAAFDDVHPDVVVLITGGGTGSPPVGMEYRLVRAADEDSVDAIIAAVRAESPGPATRLVESVSAAAVGEGPPQLTPRQVAVLRAVAQGLSSVEVSVLLGISPKSVENHKQRIFARLGVQSQAHAVAVAIGARLLVDENMDL